MSYWLVKSEPFKYSWDKFVADGRTHWDGVRNYQAANNLKAMKVGDRAFFYHSNEGLEIVGIAEVVREAYPDPSDESGRFVMVDLRPVTPVKTPLTLKDIKADPELSSMALVRQSRLSVCPITEAEWKNACRRMGVDA
ncbi:EVE domain-containing protein [Nitrospirillum pindoramense]|uniref:Putative RNA-binding protein with PUA-like domain n=1 Tax=Nitrospirillum amazonense TaxID=28077 RepID=A0A560H5W7_9PROT|nr:EVE domain-containing protein [Nitrospirillum amazonense]TWB41706.1 putative RNA-binding protein with PUA-like domain [Nitrospirillum amazonense]